MIKHNKYAAGFTIVELLIVIVVIGILAALVLNTFATARERAEYAKMQDDFSVIKKAIEIYHVDNGTYPDSTLCANTPGNVHYEYRWCGWDQGTNESLVPGIGAYTKNVPNRPLDRPKQDTYLYQSRDANCTDQGTDQYQLIRYISSGLSNAEKANNPNLMTGSGYDGIAWGYRSSGCSSWW